MAATAEMRLLMADMRLLASCRGWGEVRKGERGGDGEGGVRTWRASLEAKFYVFNVSRMLSMRAFMDLTIAP